MTTAGRRRLIAYLVTGVMFGAIAVTAMGAHLVRGWFLPVVGVTGVAILWCAKPAASRTGIAGSLVLLLPVAAWLGVVGQQPDVSGAPSAVSADSVGLQRRLGDAANPLLEGKGGSVSVLQVLLAVSQVGPAALDGRQVEIVGVSDGRSSISRLAMVCCIADARRMPLGVRGALPPAGGWVRVTGRLQAKDSSVVLVAEHASSVPTPSRPVL